MKRGDTFWSLTTEPWAVRDTERAGVADAHHMRGAHCPDVR